MQVYDTGKEHLQLVPRELPAEGVGLEGSPPQPPLVRSLARSSVPSHKATGRPQTQSTDCKEGGTSKALAFESRHSIALHCLLSPGRAMRRRPHPLKRSDG